MSKAEKGDLIRVTNAVFGASQYKNGDILTVKQRGAAIDHGVYTEEQPIYLYDYEYEIHRKAGEEDSPYKELMDFGQAEIDRHEQTKQDAVNQPSHYTQGKFETIEVIEEITKGYSDGFVAYNVGNAIKYLARAPHKHAEPLEDLRKAERYIRYAIEHEQRKNDGVSWSVEK